MTENSKLSNSEVLKAIADDIAQTLQLDCLLCVACKQSLKEPRYLPCDHVVCSKCFKSDVPKANNRPAAAVVAAKSCCPVKGCGTTYNPEKAKSALDIGLSRSLRFFNDLQRIVQSSGAADYVASLGSSEPEITSNNVEEIDDIECGKENVHVTTTSKLSFVPQTKNNESNNNNENENENLVDRGETASEASSTVSSTTTAKKRPSKGSAKKVLDDGAVVVGASKVAKTAAPRGGKSSAKKTEKPTTQPVTSAINETTTSSTMSGASDSSTSASRASSRPQSCESTVIVAAAVGAGDVTRNATPPPKSNANLDKRNAKGETALQRACKKKNGIDEVRKLLDTGANPNVCDNAGWAPLHEAAQRGDAEVIEALVAKGANVNVKSTQDGITPLHDAVSSKALRAVEALIKAGANVGLPDFSRRTPLDYAVDETIRTVLKQALANETLAAGGVAGNGASNPQQGRPVAFAVSGFSSDQSAAYSERLRTMDNMVGRVADSVTPDVTHLVVTTVADDETVCARRSLKFLQAVARGCWIVGAKWLDDSLAAGTWLPESKYEVDGCARGNPHSGGPKRARMARQTDKDPALFASCAIFFQGSFEQPAIEVDQLQELAEWLGAKVLKREPRAKLSLPAIGLPPPPAYHARADSNLRDYTVFVVRDPVLSAIPQQLRSPPICSVTYDWFLTCIETWTLKDLPSP